MLTLTATLIIAGFLLAACGAQESTTVPAKGEPGYNKSTDKTKYGGGGFTKKDGTKSYEFEDEDIERAEGASDATKRYCSGAVSEAQYMGCISHVDK